MPVNEESERRKPWTLRGWPWFVIPVSFTALYHSLGTFDHNYTANTQRWFSLPYFVIATVIGIRRGTRLTILDFLFLVFGDFLIVFLLWHLNPYVYR